VAAFPTSPWARTGGVSLGLAGSMSPRDLTAEEVLAGIARRQHGAVARVQLLAAGISSDEIRWRLREGPLIPRIYPGVYRVGDCAPSREASYMAAVLACGEGAVLSGRAAGTSGASSRATHRLPRSPHRGHRPQGAQDRGRRTPHARRRQPEATTWRGIPVTPPCRRYKTSRAPATLHVTTPRQVEAVLDVFEVPEQMLGELTALLRVARG
jgi:hypothetical protein